MSTLTRDDVIKVAHLARLAVSEKDMEIHVKNLSNILDLVDQMNSIPTEGISPMAHPLDIAQPLRQDEVTEPNERELLQTTADPTSLKLGFYVVPKAFE